jgi:cysteine desulfurase / selenocysteine lyase
MSLLSENIRKDFPILADQGDDQPLVYLDSAATSLKPEQVIDAVSGFYRAYTANVHRSVHRLSEEATDAYEGAREKVARFINADSREVAFTRNASEALNLIALNYPQKSVAFCQSEHHSNLLPWMRGDYTIFPLDKYKRIDIAAATEIIEAKRPGIVTLASISNALGIHQPFEEIARCAHNAGALVVADLSQSVGHESVDVLALECDFACFSSHKMLGPSGVGVLYQREGLSDPLTPHYVGGEMVHEAHIEGYEARPFPWGMEAGTPNIEGVIGLGAAVDYLEGVGLNEIEAHCLALASQLKSSLASLDNVEVAEFDNPHQESAIVTFRVGDIDAHGVSRILSNRSNIMVRSGFHCAQPLHELYGMAESVRASFHLYNSQNDVSRLVEAVKMVSEMS